MKQFLLGYSLTVLALAFLGAVALLFVPGCGGAPFTAEDAVFTPRPVQSADSAGDAGTSPPDSGASAQDSGASAPDSATPGDLPDAAADRDSATSTETPDAAADSASPPPDAGCPLVSHSTGVGQSWTDCEPSGTYSEVEAARACGAYAASVGGDPSTCLALALPPSATNGVCEPAAPTESEPANAVCFASLGTCSGYCWGFAGATSSGVYTCGCLSAGGWL